MQRNSKNGRPRANQLNRGGEVRFGFAAFFAVITLLFLIGIAGYRFGLKDLSPRYPEVSLPILVMMGAIVLLLTLGYLATAFSPLGLNDPEEALGLPKGSVRALIALLLIVLFAIMAIYLYQSLVTHEQRIERVYVRNTAAEKNRLLQGFDETAILQVAKVPLEGGGPDDIVYQITVLEQAETNTESQRFAQQILTTISTLVVAVAAFYFGTRAVALAGDLAQKSATRASSERMAEMVLDTARNVNAETQTAQTYFEEVSQGLENARKTLEKKQQARDKADKNLEEARLPFVESEQKEFDLSLAQENLNQIQQAYDQAPAADKAAHQTELDQAKKAVEKAGKEAQEAREKALKAKSKLETALQNTTKAQDEFNAAQAEVERLETTVKEAETAAQQAEANQKFIQLTLDKIQGKPDE